MFQIFFVIIWLFFIFCQYVVSTSDSNGVSEGSIFHNDNSQPDVTNPTEDNVVLYYYSTPDEKDYVNVVYHTKDPDNHYVYGEVFWYQTISIKKPYFQEFAKAFNYHIAECRCNRPSERESVNISEYGFCKRDCKMFYFEQQFLHNGMKRYGSSDLLKKGQDTILKIFFNAGRHARKTSWEDFFSVIGNKFLDLSGKQIFSEGKNVNPKFTYLYLLTNRFMYELGYNIGNRSLFLMRTDLMVLALHRNIKSGFLNDNNNKYSFEMPSDMIFDSQKESKQENTLQYKNIEDITERNQQYSKNDIKRNTLAKNDTVPKVKSRSKSTCNNPHILNERREESGMRGDNSSLKSKYTENEFVINKRTEFEKTLCEDIMNVYKHGCSACNVDIKYYETKMTLK